MSNESKVVEKNYIDTLALAYLQLQHDDSILSSPEKFIERFLQVREDMANWLETENKKNQPKISAPQYVKKESYWKNS